MELQLCVGDISHRCCTVKLQLHVCEAVLWSCSYDSKMLCCRAAAEDRLLGVTHLALRWLLAVCPCLLQVEAALGVEGDDILYTGDHIYTGAALAKINFR